MVVLANGDVMPCRRLPFIIGNAMKNDLQFIHQNSPVMKQLRAVGVPQGCQECRYAGLCRGGSKCAAYAKTGRFDIPDPDCCLAGH